MSALTNDISNAKVQCEHVFKYDIFPNLLFGVKSLFLPDIIEQN